MLYPPPKINLDRIIFYGRSYNEYLQFFNLDEASLKGRRILDCPAGPSSFAAEAKERGLAVVAVDSIFSEPLERLRQTALSDIEHHRLKAHQAADQYVWSYFKSFEEMFAVRHQSIDLFCADFAQGLESGRYQAAALPHLPFGDSEFDLVLSGHFLFTYADRLPYEFHLDCLRELLRVTKHELRIFPLYGLDSARYPHLDRLSKELESSAVQIEVYKSDYKIVQGESEGVVLRKV